MAGDESVDGANFLREFARIDPCPQHGKEDVKSEDLHDNVASDGKGLEDEHQEVQKDIPEIVDENFHSDPIA